MKCVVKNCANDRKHKDSEKTFFSFPREKTLIKKWLKFCNNKGTFKPKTWRICIDHFNEEDICGNGMYNMGYAVKRTLKPGAVPCRYHINDCENPERKERASRRENKKIVASLLMNAKDSEDVSIEHSTDLPAIEEPHELNIEQSSNEDYTESSIGEKDKNKIMEKEIKRLKTENHKIKDDLERMKIIHEYEISELKKKLIKAEFHCKNIEEKLKCIFTDGQIKQLKNGGKRQNWTHTDVANSIILCSASAKDEISPGSSSHSSALGSKK